MAREVCELRGVALEKRMIGAAQLEHAAQLAEIVIGSMATPSNR